jgi:hypothetical protein
VNTLPPTPTWMFRVFADAFPEFFKPTEDPMPLTKQNLDDAFSYHALDDEQKAAYARIEEAAKAFASVVLDVLPPCGDQQAACRLIFEAKATANRGVAVRGAV